MKPIYLFIYFFVVCVVFWTTPDQRWRRTPSSTEYYISVMLSQICVCDSLTDKLCKSPREMFPAQFFAQVLEPSQDQDFNLSFCSVSFPFFPSSPLQFLLTIWHRSHALQATADYGVRWEGNPCDAYHPEKWETCQAAERYNCCPFPLPFIDNKHKGFLPFRFSERCMETSVCNVSLILWKIYTLPVKEVHWLYPLLKLNVTGIFFPLSTFLVIRNVEHHSLFNTVNCVWWTIDRRLVTFTAMTVCASFPHTS